MRVSRTGLQQLLLNGAVELKFNRRHLKQGWPLRRRMLCSLDVKLLNGTQGRYALNFQPAKQQPAYDPNAHNLVCAWDIFMQDWRMIPVETVDVVRVIERKDFWPFFNDVLAPMGAAEKERFMKA